MGEWEKLVQPICRKVSVAERFGQEVVFDAKEAVALRDLMVRMATALDERVAQDERRERR